MIGRVLSGRLIIIHFSRCHEHANFNPRGYYLPFTLSGITGIIGYTPHRVGAGK